MLSLLTKTFIPLVKMAVSYDRFMVRPALPVYTLYQLSELSHPLTPEGKKVIESQIDRIALKDLITIIYTSGTRACPQANMLFDAWYGVKKLGGMAMPEVFLSFLPLSHALERTAGYHAALMQATAQAFLDGWLSTGDIARMDEEGFGAVNARLPS
jgi:long-chain acyl-CoA synthetase